MFVWAKFGNIDRKFLYKYENREYSQEIGSTDFGPVFVGFSHFFHVSCFSLIIRYTIGLYRIRCWWRFFHPVFIPKNSRIHNLVPKYPNRRRAGRCRGWSRALYSCFKKKYPNRSRALYTSLALLSLQCASPHCTQCCMHEFAGFKFSSNELVVPSVRC